MRLANVFFARSSALSLSFVYMRLRLSNGVTDRKVRGASVGALVVASVLVLSGCAAPTPQERTESERQAEAFPAVYAQELDWRTCGAEFDLVDDFESLVAAGGGHVDGARCTMIEAPFDWDDASQTETIELALMHIPSRGDAPIGTLLSNPGGPGASGIEYVVGSTGVSSFAEVHENYDLLGFDPRGVKLSTPLECDFDFGTDIIELQFALCADADPLANSIGTTQVARDMELMRALVGDEVLNYAGFSYGTVIGATYATLFPENLGRMLLDSAWPSDWSSPLGTYQQAEAIAHAVDELFAVCATDYAVTSCPLENQAHLLKTSEQLNAQPLVGSNGAEVNGFQLNGYIQATLYGPPNYRHDRLETTALALAGDPQAVDSIAEAMSGGGARVGLNGMFVRCLSSPSDANLIGVYRHIQENGLITSYGGPEITDEGLRGVMDLKCDAVPNKGNDYLMFTNESEQPILIFGVTGDHATPYAGAQQLTEELGNATLVTLEGRGHIASFQNRSSCADDIAVAYLVRGEMPAAGTVCTDN